MFLKKDSLSGFFLFLLGLFLAFQSVRSSVWAKGPGPGFFPLVISIIITGLSLVIVFKSLMSPRSREKEKILEKAEENVVDVFRVSSYAILLLFYAILIERVGFLITSALFLVLIIKFVERQGWKITIFTATTSIVVSYLLFVYLLGVPLPRGLLNW